MKGAKTDAMKVMFVCSGNSHAFGMAPFIRSQGESLAAAGVSVSYFALKGKGIGGYLKNLPALALAYRRERCDVVHAHYGFSALLALMALPLRPVVVSFMGSDAYGDVDSEGRPKRTSRLTRWIARVVERLADHLIVKSPNIRECFSDSRRITVIPNGVDLERFRPMDKAAARRLLGIDQDRRVALFLGNPACERKNFKLCKDAISRLGGDVDLVAPYPVSHDKIAAYLSAADVLVVTSHREGSPNVVKEAMACGCPVVSTDVGDVRWLLKDVSGSAVVGFNAGEVAAAVRKSFEFGNHSDGRARLIELGLDSVSIATKLERIYHSVIEEAETPAVEESRLARGIESK